MSKLYGCPCGAAQSNVEFPAPNKFHIISDRDLDGITNYACDPITIDAGGFDKYVREAYVCWRCQRLLILEKDGALRVFEERDITRAPEPVLADDEVV